MRMRLLIAIILFYIIPTGLLAQTTSLEEIAIDGVNSAYGWEETYDTQVLEYNTDESDYLYDPITNQIYDDILFEPIRIDAPYREEERVLISRRDGLYKANINTQNRVIIIERLNDRTERGISPIRKIPQH